MYLIHIQLECHAAAIGKQTVDVCTERSCSAKEVFDGFPNLCCLERWNYASTLTVELNYAPNKNTKFLLLQYFSFTSWIQQPFNRWGNFPWIQLKWVNPPVKVFKNTLLKLQQWLVAFGSLSKSSVLVRSSISSPFIFQHAVNHTATSERNSQHFVQRRMRDVFHQLTRCCHFAGHCLKEMSLLLLSGGPFFFTHASSLFPVRNLWEFLHILIIFFV